MNTAIPSAVAALIAVAILTIGTFYLVSPARISGSFGLRPPASDDATRGWLRLKGIRDAASGLVVLVLLLTASRHTLGTVLLALAIIPLGDMSIILASRGSRAKAFSIHGLTCAVMVVVGLFLTHAQ